MTKDPRLLNLFVEGLRLLYAAHHQGGEQARSFFFDSWLT